MFYYTEEEVKAIAEKILKSQVKLRAIGNHELQRHLVYHLTDDTGRSIVLKLYYKKNRWNSEVGVLKLLNNTSIKHPKIVDYGILKDDTEWLMIDYIDGKTLEDIKDQIPEGDKLKVLHQMGEELGKIHSLKTFAYYGRITEDGTVMNLGSSYATRFIKSREALVEDLLSRKYPETELLNKASEELRKNFYLVDDIQIFHLCVNDYGPRNILVKKVDEHYDLVSVIDFEHCSIGNKERDLADLYYDLASEDTRYKDAFLTGYLKYSDVSDNFFSKLNFYVLDSCLGSCTWAKEQAPEHYKKMIQILSRLVEI